MANYTYIQFAFRSKINFATGHYMVMSGHLSAPAGLTLEKKKGHTSDRTLGQRDNFRDDTEKE
jgi:hypothetical protein